MYIYISEIILGRKYARSTLISGVKTFLQAVSWMLVNNAAVGPKGINPGDFLFESCVQDVSVHVELKISD